MEIQVSRGDLLNSQTALGSLGCTTIPVRKDSYWLVKALARVNSVLKHELVAAQKFSNALIEKYGTELVGEDGTLTGKKGIKQTDVAAMECYAAEMDAYNLLYVVIDNARRIQLADLEAVGVSLSLVDQMALQWLIEE